MSSHCLPPFQDPPPSAVARLRRIARRRTATTLSGSSVRKSCSKAGCFVRIPCSSAGNFQGRAVRPPGQNGCEPIRGPFAAGQLRQDPPPTRAPVAARPPGPEGPSNGICVRAFRRTGEARRPLPALDRREGRMPGDPAVARLGATVQPENGQSIRRSTSVLATKC